MLAEPAAEAVSAAAVETVASDEDDDALPAVGKVWDASGPSLSELLKQRQSASPPPEPEPAAIEINVEPVNVGDLPVIWQRMLDLLAARGAWLYSALKTGRLASIDEDAAVLRFDKHNATFVKLLSGKKDLLRDILTQAVGKPLGVRFEVDEESAAPQPAGDDDGSASRGVAANGATRVQPASAPPRVVKTVQREIEAPPAPAPNLIKVTPEVIEILRNNEPLIKGLMDELGAQIVKIESPEPAAASS